MFSRKILDASISDFATSLAAMIDDELYATMELLETESESPKDGNVDEILARIALTESEIERRHPGQLLRPYLDWKERNVGP
ncbi:hypothetical protein [Rhizobium grahamii]|uniref:Uncharacterized protein n=1 Tax=Rhizobium grahamii TaxID=1120045 RepID=A0A370KFQ7_9HYPH|nr:hypothetical protein [Rhizobium grahamii]RDJ03278.1 hypothetical protein B5K06_30230 [Rhizobium grahamii]